MTLLYVIDTVSFIDYFDNIFGRYGNLSYKARNIIDNAFNAYSGLIKLSIPSVVLVEIYEKWFSDEEFAAKFYYEVYSLIKTSPNIEIKPIEREVLENLIKIGGNLTDHEIHDKLILSSAMMMKCPLITRDPEIIKYFKNTNVIPAIIN